MARKSGPPAPAAAKVNEEAINTAQAAAGERAVMLMEINRLYGGGSDYAKDRVMAEAKFFLEQGNQAAFELGKRLILLKEHEGHGGFIKALETMDMDRMAAWRLMSNTAKFSNVTSMLHLPQTKLLALSFMDDAEVDALAKGGTVYGLDLDDVECMSVRQLKEKLRSERAEREADQELLAKKQAKIEKLERANLKRQPFDVSLNKATTALKEIADLCEENLTGLQAMVMHIEELWTDAPAEQRGSVATQIHEQVNRAFMVAANLQEYFNDAIAPHVPAVRQD